MTRRRGLAFGGWGKGLALGKQKRRTLRQVRLLTPAQMKAQPHPMGCVCDDKACNVCTPEPIDEKETDSDRTNAE